MSMMNQSCLLMIIIQMMLLTFEIVWHSTLSHTHTSWLFVTSFKGITSNNRVRDISLVDLNENEYKSTLTH
jgi:hypothetical protein